MVGGGRWGAEDGLQGFSLEVREQQRSSEASAHPFSPPAGPHFLEPEEETPPRIQHPSLPVTEALLDGLAEAGFGEGLQHIEFLSLLPIHSPISRFAHCLPTTPFHHTFLPDSPQTQPLKKPIHCTSQASALLDLGP